MELAKPKLRFDSSGYYFIGLFALALLGFWPSYFSKFFSGKAGFSFYFHFHAIMMGLWIGALVVQPILIRKKKLTWHRFIGKLTYLLMPLLFIAVMLLAHSRHPLDQENLDTALFVPFKDLLILGTMYIIAIWYRHDVHVHARAMVATGIVFIEPALVRFIGYIFTSNGMAAYLATIAILYLLLIGLMIKERKQKRGRWVFPLTLGMYIVVHAILISGVHIGIWQSFSKWFAGLPLT